MKKGTFSEDIQEFLNKPSTITFLLVAREFVSLLEQDSIEISMFLKKSHAALVNLYAAGHNLEQIPLKYSGSNKFDRDELFLNRNAGFISKIAEETFYWEIFDPAYTEKDSEPGPGWKITDSEPSQGWLKDDFDDIYRDLKIELNKIDLIGTEEAIEDGLWQLKWSFLNHWGNHCINALRYLHYLCYEGKNIM